MLSEREVSASIGSTAYGANGDKLGTVEQLLRRRPHRRADLGRGRRPACSAPGTRSCPRWTPRSTRPAACGCPSTADAVKSAPHLTGDHLTRTTRPSCAGTTASGRARRVEATAGRSGEQTTARPADRRARAAATVTPRTAWRPRATRTQETPCRHRRRRRAAHGAPARRRRDDPQRGAARRRHRAGGERRARGWSSTW